MIIGIAGSHRHVSRRTLMVAISFALTTQLAAQSSERMNFPLSLADSSPDWAWRTPQPEGCLASIPATRMHRVPIYLSADMSPVIDTMITLQADLMAQDVATELTRRLGATSTSLVNANDRDDVVRRARADRRDRARRRECNLASEGVAGRSRRRAAPRRCTRFRASKGHGEIAVARATRGRLARRTPLSLAEIRRRYLDLRLFGRTRDEVCGLYSRRARRNRCCD